MTTYTDEDFKRWSKQRESDLRDEFAGRAMQGMFSADTEDWHTPAHLFYERAKSAYAMADAMLAQRAK